MAFIIRDWAGNEIVLPIANEKLVNLWDTFEDAESDLDEFLGDSYETDRGEYYILPLEKKKA